MLKGLRNHALAAGFDACAVTKAELPQSVTQHLDHFIECEHYGDMTWFVDTHKRRRQPRAMWPQARSAIVLAMNYGPQIDPLARLAEKDTGTISVYALNRDYHDIVKGKLKNLAQWVAKASGGDVKVFVDTAPVLEKPLAQQAGLGWQGKHTNLVSRQLGSWFFLGLILSAVDLTEDEVESDHCGTCRKCLDICPTKAFPAPYQLDARRCISYLTIEHKGHIPVEFRHAMGNRIYGCDDCLAICPWNRFAQIASEVKLVARDDLRAPRLDALAALDDGAFRKLFSGSPVKRIGRNRFVRNVLIAIANSGDKALTQSALKLIEDDAPVVRAMAIWALAQLSPEINWRKKMARQISCEKDTDVLTEWNALP